MNSNNHHPTDGIGAVVIGGDYQGLGIVRSLGRRGIPVCVIDDERSIARYSRYTTTAQLVPSLLAAKDTVKALLDLGRARGLRGWVLYPTRDEQVAALSQNREELSEIFRVPTPGWETVKWLWDKRNTYRLADKLAYPHASHLVSTQRRRPLPDRRSFSSSAKAGDQGTLHLRDEGQGLEGQQLRAITRTI